MPKGTLFWPALESGINIDDEDAKEGDCEKPGDELTTEVEELEE